MDENQEILADILPEKLKSWIPTEILSFPHTLSPTDKNFLSRKYGITELHWVALTGSMAKAAALLNESTRHVHKTTLSNLSWLSAHKEIQGVTPLFLAARCARTSLVGILLEHAAVNDILKPGFTGDTALHAAALSGDVKVVDELLSALATTPDGKKAVNKEGSDSRTPLHYAAGGGHDVVVGALLRAGANVLAPDKYGVTPFHFAAGWGNSTSCMELLMKNLSTELCIDDARDKKGWTALHYAAGNKQLDTIRWLQKRYASVNAVDFEHGNTPLHVAARHPDVIGLLTEAGADTWFGNKHQECAIELAHKHKDGKAVRAHISAIRKRRQEDVNPFAKHGKNEATLLHYVVAYGTAEDMAWIVGLLEFQNSMDGSTSDKAKQTSVIDVADKTKQTAVHWAAIAGNFKALRILIEHKADINALDVQNRDALCLAIAHGKADVRFIKAFLALPSVKLQIPQWATHEKAARWMKEYYIHHNMERALSKLKKPEKTALWSFMMRWVSDTFSVQQGHAPRFGRIASMATPREVPPASIGTFKKAQPASREAQPATSNAGAYKILDDFPSIYLALHAKNKDIAIFMKEHIKASAWQDAVINKRGEETQRTALHWATIHGELDIVVMLCTDPLFSKDLKPNLEDKYGKTPLQYAKELNQPAIEKQLMERQDVKIHLEELYRDRQVYVDAANAVLVVAALIASVTFVGWLQPPLNYVTYYDMQLPGAPDGAYASYAAVQQHVGVRVFWGLNCLSFTFAIASVLAGLVGVVPVPNRYIAATVVHLRRTLWVASATLTLSIVLVLGAFAAAGFTVLPPMFKYQINMLCTILLGGIPCILLLIWYVCILCVSRQSTPSDSPSTRPAPLPPPKPRLHCASRPWEGIEFFAWFYNPELPTNDSPKSFWQTLKFKCNICK